MEHEQLAPIGGSFRNGTHLNATIAKGDELGTIIQFGTPTPVMADWEGTVIWIRDNGKVRGDEKLYLILAPAPAGPVVIAEAETLPDDDDIIEGDLLLPGIV
jgi:predicted deacylase